MPLLAVHISDGVLAWVWLPAGFAAAGLLVAWSARRVAEAEVARIGVLTAAFFVASLIHVRLGPTSVHLLLNGLVGITLGRRAPLAVGVGLMLQALLLGHGGFTSLGVNCVVMALPALLARPLYRRLSGTLPPDVPGWREVLLAVAWILSPLFMGVLALGAAGLEWRRRSRPAGRAFRAGFAVGCWTVLLTALLNSAVLVVAGAEDWRIIAAAVFAAHVPLALVEGFITGCAAAFLERVNPDVLGTTGGPG